MIDRELETLAAFVESAYPETQVRVLPFSGEEDPDIEWQVWVLNAPHGLLHEIEDRALDKAIELYGERPLRFLVSVAGVEKTERYLRHLLKEWPSRPTDLLRFSGAVVGTVPGSESADATFLRNNEMLGAHVRATAEVTLEWVISQGSVYLTHPHVRVASPDRFATGAASTWGPIKVRGANGEVTAIEPEDQGEPTDDGGPPSSLEHSKLAA